GARAAARWPAGARGRPAGGAPAGRGAAGGGGGARRGPPPPALAGLARPAPYPELFRPWLALRPRIGYALETLLRPDVLPAIDRTALVAAAAEEVAADEPAHTWGAAHRLAPWRAVPDTDADRPQLAGDHDCVLATSAVPGVTDRCARGPAARFVWDLADRAGSAWIVPFGASGTPGHPHHRDQLPHWLGGTLVPVTTDWHLLTEERHVR
ncbi:penicillin acylase family protein, partial [Kitasatospora sp. NPDC059571]|uniref:penicillin acylase family protein n=1 Tax=Kitasatospora sp. NPDC059571 TaxID=3346871 RepID=UPI0036C7CAEF